MTASLLEKIKQFDTKSLARAISIIENEQAGYEDLLRGLEPGFKGKIIGLTGPPGAGKSTLADAMIGEFTRQGKKVGVLCVDPSSAFNLGALLGDRIRMSEWYTNENVFIRSLATRGSLGGLSPKIIEITELMKTAGFDYILVETVGVGQTEIEIVGLADVTVVVLVPEAGDEVQTMKSGLMEIADLFVVNKSDRPGADLFVKNLAMMTGISSHDEPNQTQIIKTVATEKKGIIELLDALQQFSLTENIRKNHLSLLVEKAWQLLIQKRMKDVSREELKNKIESLLKKNEFNLYRFVENL